MVYVLFLKDEIAIAKSCYKSLENITLGNYDNYIEVSKDDFVDIVLPAIQTKDGWRKTGECPYVECVAIETSEYLSNEDMIETETN